MFPANPGLAGPTALPAFAFVRRANLLCGTTEWKLCTFGKTVQASTGSVSIMWLLKGLHLLGGREWVLGQQRRCLCGFSKAVCVCACQNIPFLRTLKTGSVCLPERGREKIPLCSPFGLCTGQDSLSQRHSFTVAKPASPEISHHCSLTGSVRWRAGTGGIFSMKPKGK